MLRSNKGSMNIKTIIIIVVAVLILFAVVFFLGRKFGKESVQDTLVFDDDKMEVDDGIVQSDVTVNNRTVESTIAPASELVSSKYYYTDVGNYEKSKKIDDFTIPFTTDKSVYSYSGIISAGIDMSEVDCNVDNENKKIVITIPEPKVLSHELDESSFKSYDVKKSIFTSSNLNDYAEFVGELKTTEEDKLKGNKEFWDGLKKNTENTLKGFLDGNSDLDGYDFEFNWKEGQ